MVGRRGWWVAAAVAALFGLSGVQAPYGGAVPRGEAGSAGERTEVRDNTQELFYAALDPKDADGEDPHLTLGFGHEGPLTGPEVELDTTGLRGVAEVADGGGCERRGRTAVYACAVDVPSEGDATVVVGLKALPGKPGRTGTLRYTLTADGIAPLRGSTTVVAGRPELRVMDAAPPGGLKPGSVFRQRLVVRNEGDLPAHGVHLSLSLDDLSVRALPSNCRTTEGGRKATCRLDGAVLAPGQTAEVTPAPALKVDPKGVSIALQYSAWAEGTYVPVVPYNAGKPRPGDGTPLRLTRPGRIPENAAFARSQDAPFHVPNKTDLQARGTSLRGDVGTGKIVTIGWRQNGPSELADGGAELVFEVPPGADVEAAPYDHERDEEMHDQVCEPADAGKRTWVCKQPADAGEDVRYEFTLRIARKDSRPGSVRISVPDAAAEWVTDPDPANDVAEVSLEATGEAPAPKPAPDSDDGPALWAAAAGGGVIVLTGVAILVRRRFSA
ncbi:hypothetical protein ACIBI4_05465 [Streptomyces sp. NPDC050418]|uniref:hypothetical protein n=1 Tax=Streptomyces sp. NPDC050418 TaxID=3365612 RepID=UPI00378C02B0